MADRQADRLVEVQARKAAIKSGQIGKQIRHERRGLILTAFMSGTYGQTVDDRNILVGTEGSRG